MEAGVLLGVLWLERIELALRQSSVVGLQTQGHRCARRELTAVDGRIARQRRDLVHDAVHAGARDEDT